MRSKTENVVVRAPSALDGARVHALVRDCSPLELNTAYAYVLLTSHFSATTVVAEDADGLCGFAAGYCRPDKQNVLFVWQIGVAQRARGMRMGIRLLRSLLDRQRTPRFQYVEATVAPSNEASRRLFHSLAKELGAGCTEEPYWGPEHFGAGIHEPETLYRVGPLP